MQLGVIKCFTDGWKLNNIVGSAFLIYNENNVETYCIFRLPDYSTVFIAKLIAIHQAIEYLKSNYTISRKISIISDSKFALMSISNNRNYELKWAKAHVGNVGTERAEYLVKLATSKVDIDVNIKMTNCVKKKELLKYYINKWQTCWSESNKDRNVWNFIDQVNIHIIYSDFYLNRLVTGHGIDPNFQKRMFNRDDTFLCGQRKADMNHIITHCWKFNNIKDQYFPTHYLELKDFLKSKRSTIGIRLIIKEYFNELMSHLCRSIVNYTFMLLCHNIRDILSAL